MNLLAFETSSPSGGVALLCDRVLAGESWTTGMQSHSKRCLREAEGLLEAAGLRWEDVDVFAASHGPGAFVGVRVGLSLIKGLAWPLGKPVVTVSSPEALAWSCYRGEPVRHVVPLLDARVGEVYGAVFTPTDEGLVREGEEFCLRPEEVPRLLDGEALFAGEGALRYHEKYLHPHGRLARGDAVRARPGTVAWLAWQRVQAGGTIPPSEARAVYLRDATVKPNA